MKHPGIIEHRMAKKNLMDKGDHHGWASRDYADIDCNATGCMWNKHLKCSVPSLCEILPDGKCKGFKIPPQQRGLDGD
jgi:hypothetical protein